MDHLDSSLRFRVKGAGHPIRRPVDGFCRLPAGHDRGARVALAREGGAGAGVELALHPRVADRPHAYVALPLRGVGGDDGVGSGALRGALLLVDLDRAVTEAAELRALD